MIVGPHEEEFQGFNRDATNGMPYVTHLPNRTELFLVMPVRQWNAWELYMGDVSRSPSHHLLRALRTSCLS
jgi:hypothetical protein